MAGSTPNLGLYLPGGGSTGTYVPDEVADIDTLNQNFVLLDTAIGDPDEQNRQWYGPAAQIGTLPDSPKDGDTYQESDGSKRRWLRVAGVWVTNEGGAYLIRPTGTNGTIQPNGHVTPPPASTLVALELRGVFTSRFRRYMIVGDWTVQGGANGLELQFMNGAVVDSAAQYYGQNQSNASTAVNTSAVSAVTNLAGVAVAGIDHAATWMIFSPAESALRTRMTFEHMCINSGTGLSLGGGGHLTLKAHDGIVFRLSTTSGRSFTPEGTDFAVYGLV